MLILCRFLKNYPDNIVTIYGNSGYISLNDDKLRDCCLDISEYATRKEGLA
jgi:hypothetical protein